MTYKLIIPYDAHSSEELITFIKTSFVPLSPEQRACTFIKVNDLLAEIGITGLKALSDKILTEIGIHMTWMIDGKWYDIPNTVANYAARLAGLDVLYYTVHASGGTEMIRAAKAAAPDKKLLAITILTSMKDAEVRGIYAENRANAILRLANIALSA